MAQINPRTISQARDLGEQVYELILTNWGNRGMKQDPNNGSIVYPPHKGAAPTDFRFDPNAFVLPTLPSLSAIAIAPRSLVDRCIIQYTSQLQAAADPRQLPPLQPPSATMLETEQVLAVESPLIGQQLGPIVIRAAPEEYYGDVLVKAAGAPATGFTPPTRFGTELPMNVAAPGGLVWVNPELRLLLYFTGKGALPPTARAPWNHRFDVIGIGAVPTPAENLVAVIPVMGRQKAIVDVKNSSFGSINVVITGAFRGLSADNEVPLVASTTLAADAGIEIDVFGGSRPGVNFILIYLTPGVLPPGGGGADVSVTLY